MLKSTVSVCITLLLAGLSTAQQIEAFVGEVKIWPVDFAPTGWALCDGSVLPIRNYNALYALLGTKYGGDGITTFGLPDLRGRVPRGAGIVTELTTVQLGQKGGAETATASGPAVGQFTLKANNIPPHSHPGSFVGKSSTSSFTSTIDVSTSNGGVTPQNGGYLAQASNSGTGAASIFFPPGSVPPTVALNGGKGSVTVIPQGDVTVGDSAGPVQPVVFQANINAPVKVLDPYQGFNYIIATSGIFPMRP